MWRLFRNMHCMTSLSCCFVWPGKHRRIYSSVMFLSITSRMSSFLKSLNSRAETRHDGAPSIGVERARTPAGRSLGLVDTRHLLSLVADEFEKVADRFVHTLVRLPGHRALSDLVHIRHPQTAMEIHVVPVYFNLILPLYIDHVAAPKFFLL